jgi:hypothetical protein
MNPKSMTNKKKYTLKPGKHQFAPGSAATHHNNNLSDAEAEWYIEKYPHIAILFEPTHSTTDREIVDMQPEIKELNDNQIQPGSQAELLTPSLEGRGDQ